VTKAERKVETVCNEITKGIVRKRGFNLISRLLGLIQVGLFPNFEKVGMKRVWISNDCTQCGLCAASCPMSNLICEDNKIVAKGKCVMCYRCINSCPQKAISVFLRGKVKKQYKGVYHG
jgi:ferredoxin